MSSPADNFEKLRKLLVLKKYEQPPPGYFCDFPGRVIARLERAETLAALPWWRRLSDMFVLKPAFAAGCAAVACGLLSIGMMTSQEEGSAGLGSITEARLDTPSAVSAGVLVRAHAQPVFAPQEYQRSTDPVTPATASPFDVHATVQRISFNY